MVLILIVSNKWNIDFRFYLRLPIAKSSTKKQSQTERQQFSRYISYFWVVWGRGGGVENSMSYGYLKKRSGLLKCWHFFIEFRILFYFEQIGSVPADRVHVFGNVAFALVVFRFCKHSLKIYFATIRFALIFLMRNFDIGFLFRFYARKTFMRNKFDWISKWRRKKKTQHNSKRKKNTLVYLPISHRQTHWLYKLFVWHLFIGM